MSTSRTTGAFWRRRQPAAAGSDLPRRDASPPLRDASEPAAAPAAYGSSRGAATAVRAAGFSLARLVRAVAAVIALLIAAAIILRVLNANPSSGVVKAIHDAANVFASPFTGMFNIHGARASLAVNWGIALLCYLIVGALIARTIARVFVGTRRV